MLGSLGLSSELVAAGIVHGAYRRGDFGWWRMFLQFQRQPLRSTLGAQVEEYVYRFRGMPWRLEAAREMLSRLDRLERIDRDVLLLQLANDLDNASHGSLLYCADADRRREQLLRKGPLLVEIADRLGVPKLARALAAAIEQTATDDVLPALRWQLTGTRLVVPASARPRLRAVYGRSIVRGLRRARQFLDR